MAEENNNDEYKIKKLFWKVTEVAEMFNCNASLIRLWETQFDILKPRRINSRGDRKYNAKDIENFRLVYHLMREKGYSISGAQQKIKELQGGKETDTNTLKMLYKVRDFLQDLRRQL